MMPISSVLILFLTATRLNHSCQFKYSGCCVLAVLAVSTESSKRIIVQDYKTNRQPFMDVRRFTACCCSGNSIKCGCFFKAVLNSCGSRHSARGSHHVADPDIRLGGHITGGFMNSREGLY